MMITPELATTPILAMKYVLRYVLIGVVIFGIWYYDLLPVAAVIAGLASFAIAVVLRGLKSIFTSSQ
jgi:small-conductance mechanosensitive channel